MQHFTLLPFADGRRATLASNVQSVAKSLSALQSINAYKIFRQTENSA